MQPMTRFTDASIAVWRQQLWLAILVFSALAASYIFACATPFAALAAAASLTLNRNNGVVFIVAAWVGNQVIGYTILDYPRDAYSFIWGVVIGGGALVALVSARMTAYYLAGACAEWVRISTCFAAALISSQLFMFAAALSPLGGLGGFTAEVIRQIVAINAIAMVGIYALNLLAITVGFLPSAAAKSAA